MLARSERREVRVDVRDDLVAEVGVVVADRRRVEVLRAAERGERVDEHDHRLGGERVDPVRVGERPRLDVEPRVDHARHALDHVDARVPARLVLGHPDVQRPLVRIAERVAAERFGHE